MTDKQITTEVIRRRHEHHAKNGGLWDYFDKAPGTTHKDRGILLKKITAVEAVIQGLRAKNPPDRLPFVNELLDEIEEKLK